MDNVVSLPTTDTPGLRVLYLVPQERQAWFTYRPEDLDLVVGAKAVDAPILCLRDDGELIEHNVNFFFAGGIIETVALPDPPDRTLAHARRLTKSELATWDGLRTLDRLHLQLDWTRETLHRAEETFQTMLSIPFEEDNQGHGRWSLAALDAQINLVRQLVGETFGLQAAINSL
jgi:hypothetical protein